MKTVIIRPLSVEEGKLLVIAREALGDRMEIVYYDTRTTDTAGLVEYGKDAGIIVVSNPPLNVQIIEGCKNPRLLAAISIGVDRITMDVYKKNSVTACNCTGYSTCVVAGLVFGTLISLYKNVTLCDKVCRKEDIEDGLIGFELEGKTFDVVGAGVVGPRVAAIAQAFGCRVLAYSGIARDVPGVRYANLETLPAEYDVVSLHTPLTGETRGLMNEECIGLMRKNAVFINAAKGPAMNNDVLAETLKGGRIAGACIDVSGNRPPVREDHPLFSAPNAMVTSHVALATREALAEQAVITFDNVVDYPNEVPRDAIG